MQKPVFGLAGNSGQAITGVGTSATVLQIGETITRTATTTEPGTKIWSSSNPSVATVNAFTGVITAVSPGTTTIQYTSSNGAVNSVTVTVYATAQETNPSYSGTGTNGNLAEGDTAISPDQTITAGSGQTITWTSSNPSKISVDTEGKISRQGGGSAVISYVITDDADHHVVQKGSVTVTADFAINNDVTLTAKPTAMFTIDSAAKVIDGSAVFFSGSTYVGSALMGHLEGPDGATVKLFSASHVEKGSFDLLETGDYVLVTATDGTTTATYTILFVTTP
ncbi:MULTISPECIES: Ig-like domain-containing protein [Brevibacillus]|uniref:Ig-like domain-containing protein n=1 Tax=Brevibacillus TaxID=55080 RepID=UPI000EE48C4C|nr:MULTISPECIES: Ig-like domain-containing protein [Brevibacillus]NRQ52834.1 Ig-like domain-containing protein [Brevibacillus sp. HD1.4A]RNB96669.1 hypothetical protein EDM60_04895 [Brevibacillus parabrevis]UED70393.1 Ig-like domain-containing protein [Brevibacillus sp. HD3.3A]HBZ81064.1 hypothetical protein [Brevibacillus sp.]